MTSTFFKTNLKALFHCRGEGNNDDDDSDDDVDDDDDDDDDDNDDEQSQYYKTIQSDSHFNSSGVITKTCKLTKYLLSFATNSFLFGLMLVAS